jgi:hypothetical protein
MGQQGFQVAFFQCFCQCSGSVTFWYGPVRIHLWIRILSFRQGLSRWQHKIFFCFQRSFAYYGTYLLSLNTFRSVFKDNKSLRNHLIAKIMVIKMFLLVDVRIRIRVRKNNYGSRSSRPKNTDPEDWFLRITLLFSCVIHAGADCISPFFYSACLVVQISAQCIVHLVSLPSSTVHSYSVTARHLKIFSHWALVCQT